MISTKEVGVCLLATDVVESANRVSNEILIMFFFLMATRNAKTFNNVQNTKGLLNAKTSLQSQSGTGQRSDAGRYTSIRAEQRDVVRHRRCRLRLSVEFDVAGF